MKALKMDRSHLETLLSEVGSEVAFPDTPDIVDAVMRSVVAPPPVWTRRFRLVLATALVMIVMLTVLPGPRRAVADLLGLGGVGITVASELPQAAVAGEFSGLEVTLQAAQTEVDFALLVPDGIAGPDVVFLDDSVPGGLVTLAYQPGRESYGLVITEMVGMPFDPILEKVVESDEVVVPVEVADNEAFWIEGPHALFILSENGEGRSEPPRLVGNTLLFSRGDVTIRIESALDLTGAVDIAESLLPFDR